MLGKSFATLIIPCAGKGSRLNLNLPKCLAEIGNSKTMLSEIVTEIAALFSELVLVVSEEGIARIKDEIDSIGRSIPLPIVKYVIQPSPTGSLNAVNLGLAVSSNLKSVIVWGDQIGVRRKTIAKILIALEKYRVAVPITLTRKPYVWISPSPRDFSITSIRRSRDGDHSPLYGFADLGVFGVRDEVKGVFMEEELILTRKMNGREKDFVYALAAKNIAKKTRLILRLNLGQTKAINTPEELAQAMRKNK